VSDSEELHYRRVQIRGPRRADLRRNLRRLKRGRPPGALENTNDPAAFQVGETGFEPDRRVSDNYAMVHAFSLFHVSERSVPGSVLCPGMPQLTPPLPPRVGDIRETLAAPHDNDLRAEGKTPHAFGDDERVAPLRFGTPLEQQPGHRRAAYECERLRPSQRSKPDTVHRNDVPPHSF
jgi:hypothetical protein